MPLIFRKCVYVNILVSTLMSSYHGDYIYNRLLQLTGIFYYYYYYYVYFAQKCRYNIKEK